MSHITEPERSEEVRREIDDRFRRLVEVIPVAVYVCDKTGIIQNYNQRAVELWGREPRPWDRAQRHCGSLRLYSSVGKLVPHEESKMAEVLRTGIEARDLEEVIERADGSRITVLVNIVPLRNAGGALIGAMSCFQDITDRKRSEGSLRESEQAEEALRRAAEQAQMVGDAIPVQIWSGPADGTLDFCNDQWRAYTGLDLAELQGDGWQRMLHPDDRDRVLRAWGTSIATGTPYEQEERHRAADGTYRWFLCRGIPTRNKQGDIERWYGANTDITDRKYAEEARKSAEEQLAHSRDHLRALAGKLMNAQDDERRRIAQMLHETTAQNLAGLKMLLARLNRTSDRLSDDERNVLVESMSLAEQSMTEIRTLSYLLHPPFLDEAGLLSALRWYAAGFAERSGIDVDLDLPESFGRLARDTEIALFRIVQESLINIHRHAGSKTAHIRLQRDAETLVLEVDDQGHGIPSASLEQIMSGGGIVGVGIAGMSERMEQLGGSLEITSGDQGTTVRARLRLVKDAD